MCVMKLIRSGAVPVVLAGLEVDAVAWADDLDGLAAALAEPDALRDPDRLAQRVRVPGRAPGVKCTLAACARAGAGAAAIWSM